MLINQSKPQPLIEQIRADDVWRPKVWSEVSKTDRLQPFIAIFYTYDHPLGLKNPSAGIDSISGWSFDRSINIINSVTFSRQNKKGPILTLFIGLSILHRWNLQRKALSICVSVNYPVKTSFSSFVKGELPFLKVEFKIYESSFIFERNTPSEGSMEVK